jgi:hypothetical protein
MPRDESEAHTTLDQLPAWAAAAVTMVRLLPGEERGETARGHARAEGAGSRHYAALLVLSCSAPG